MEKKKIEKKIINFRQYLIDNFSLNTVYTIFGPIMVIYRYFEIEIHKLPPINRKAANTTEPIQFGDLPDKEIIRKAVEIATPTMKPIIYFMSSSGCAKRETLNLSGYHCDWNQLTASKSSSL